MTQAGPRHPRLRAAALLAAAAALLALAPTADAQNVLTFKAATDETSNAGIGFVRAGFVEATPSFVETTGGGACWGDMDADGDLDLFVTNGYLTGESHTSKLYRNVGGGKFEDATAAAGVALVGHGQGCAWGDYDNDGDSDLYVAFAIMPSHARGNALLENRGGVFVDVAPAAGVTGQEGPKCEPTLVVAGVEWDRCYGTSVAWLDFDNDGDLDLYVLNYAQLDVGLCVSWPNPDPGHCTGQRNRLYRNDADGTFTDVADDVGVAYNEDFTRGHSLGVVAADLDHDGWTDVYVTNDMDANGLYMNLGGAFESSARDRGADNSDATGAPRAGMGVDAQDFDNDGFTDLLSTHLSGQLDAVYENDGDHTWTDRSEALGATLNGVSRWGGGYVDLDNDGWKDLLVVSGDQSSGQPGPTYLYFWDAAQSKFVEAVNSNEVTYAGAGVGGANLANARAAAFADYDDDGDLDVFTVGLQDDAGEAGTSRLIRFNILGEGSAHQYNAWDENHWIGVKLRGVTANRDGVGAVVKVTAGSQSQWLLAASGGSYEGNNDPRLRFGLGAATSGTVTVYWPAVGGAVHEQSVAFDVAGLAAKGKYISVTEDRDLPPPAVRLREATVIGDVVRLSWTPSFAPDASGYVLYRGASADFAPEDALETVSLAGRGATTYEWDGLAPNTDHWFRVAARDAAGQVGAASASAHANVFLEVPPVPVVAPVPASECDAGGAAVTLDASGSYDPAGQPLTFRWEAAGVAFDDPASATPTAFFPLGSTRVTLRVSDGNESATARVTVLVEDTLAPVVTVTRPSPGQLYVLDRVVYRDVRDPVPHRILAVGPVTAVAEVVDRCGVASVRFTSGDGGDVTLSAAPFEHVVDLPASASGENFVRALATDLGGNVAESEARFTHVGTRVDPPGAPEAPAAAASAPVAPDVPADPRVLRDAGTGRRPESGRPSRRALRRGQAPPRAIGA